MSDLIDAAALEAATAILDRGRIMSIATIRPDGWPQSTIVGYANEGLTIYFLIFRLSQKFANIAREDRVSLTIGAEPPDLSLATAVYAGARAAEVSESVERDHAWRLLVQRHPNLAGTTVPQAADAAIIKARCVHVSIVDYNKGYGHTDALHWLSEGKEVNPSLLR